MTALQSWLSCVELTSAADALPVLQAFANREHYRTPTPGEVSWEIYSAAATGNRGVIGFCWDRDGGAEGRVSLRDPSMQQQFAAFSRAYRNLARWAAVLDSAQTFDWHTAGPQGELVAGFSGPRGLWLLLIAGPYQAFKATVPASVAWEYGAWLPMLGRGSLSVSVAAGEARFVRVWW